MTALRRFVPPLLALTLLWTAAGRAAVIHVPEDYVTLAGALAAAAPGDEVVLAAGTHLGPATVWPGLDGIAIRGESSSSTTYVGLLELEASVVLEDLEFTGSTGNRSLRALASIGSLTVRDCAFTGGGSPIYLGGAVAADVGIERCTSSGSARFLQMFGGSLQVGGCDIRGTGALLQTSDTDVELLDSFFGTEGNGNSPGLGFTGISVLAVSGCEFDGVRVAALVTQAGTADVQIAHCTFRDSRSGFLDLYGHLESVEIDACEFRGNRSSTQPAVELDLVGVPGAPAVRITDCLFLDNGLGSVVPSEPALAATDVMSTATLEVTGCTFSRNDGGALQGQGLSALTVESCTFFENSRVGYTCGGHLYVTGSTSLALTDCLLTGNPETSALYAPDATLLIECCDIWGNAGGDWQGSCATSELAAALGQDGNVSVDPRFCDEDPHGLEDWTLASASPLGGTGCADPAGAWPIDDTCVTVAIRPSTWGNIKAAYRGDGASR